MAQIGDGLDIQCHSTFVREKLEMELWQTNSSRESTDSICQSERNRLIQFLKRELQVMTQFGITLIVILLELIMELQKQKDNLLLKLDVE